jgi:arsenate reductase
MNDLQSQIAEYFLNEMYGDTYEVCSAGPKFDYIDCELISVMYQEGYDIRAGRAKDFREKKIPAKLDYIVFLEKATYDRIKEVIPWDAPQILFDFGRKNNFEAATDDAELAECYKELIEKVRVWVQDTFKDPEKLESMVA